MNRTFGVQRVMLLAVAGALVCAAPSTVAAATCTWTGAGTDAFWSNPANWSGCAGVAPQNGDDLVFPAGGARPANQNDIANLTLGTIEIAGVGVGNTAYDVNGLGVTLTTGFLFNAPSAAFGQGAGFFLKITQGAPLTLANSGSGFGRLGEIETNGFTLIFDPSTADISVYGPISGNDSVVKNGSGTLRLLQSGSTFGDQNHPFLITAGEVISIGNSVPDDVLVSVAQGARWTPGTDVVGNVAGEGEIALTTSRLTVSGGMSSEWTGVMTQTTQGTPPDRFVVNLLDATLTLTGEPPPSGLTMQRGTLRLNRDLSALALIEGTVDLNGAGRTIQSFNDSEYGVGIIELGGQALTIEAGFLTSTLIRDQGQGGRLIKAGTGTLLVITPFTVYTFAGPMILQNGTLVVDSIQAFFPVQVIGGTLQGIGRVTTIDATGGTISPGSPTFSTAGHLWSHSVQLDSTTTFAAHLHLEPIQVGHPLQEQQNDRLIVAGTVTLSDATLALSTIGDSAAPESFLLIDNDDEEPVAGTFAGLPEGAVMELANSPSFGPLRYRITYTGGNGNDVLLVKEPSSWPPPGQCTWTGAGATPNWSDSNNWTSCRGWRPQDHDTVVFPAGALRPVNYNDLFQLRLSSLEITGAAAGNVRYTINGSTIVVDSGGTVRFSAPADANGFGPELDSLSASGPVSVSSVAGAAPVFLYFIGGDHPWTFDAAADIDVNVVNGHFGINKNGNATLRVHRILANDGPTRINSGTLLVNVLDWSRPVTVMQLAGGVLGGIGLVGPIEATAGQVSPGPVNVDGAPVVTGTLWPGSVTMSAGASLAIDLQAGTSEPFGSDRLAVTGTVDLGGARLLLSAATLPERAVIIANDGDDPIVGTFAGLPEGALVEAGSALYRISYKAFSGNDVELTRVTSLTYLLAEGATGTFFDYDLLIANPNTAAAPVTVTFFTRDGQTIVEPRTIAPQSRLTLHVDTLAGLEQTEASARVVSEEGLPLAVERTMFWDATGYGGHTAEAVSEPSAQWYFAEGSQGFFHTYLLVVNPSASPADLTFTFLRENDTAVIKTLNVPGNGRLTVYAGDIPELADRSFGVSVQATQPVVVERAMYFASSPQRIWLGGHGSIGVAAPSRHWFFAEGATGSFFDTYILLANPATAPVDATVTFLGAAGETFSTTKTVPAQGRLTLDMDFETAGHLPPGAVATVIDAPSDLIAERSMYWSGDASPWGEAHNSFGIVQAGTHWGLAEGRLGGARQYTSYILLANSETAPAEVQVTYLRENGAPIVRTHTVPANTRFNIDVGADAPELNDASFGADVRVTNGVPITVERSIYWNANVIFWAGGSNAPATRLPQD